MAHLFAPRFHFGINEKKAISIASRFLSRKPRHGGLNHFQPPGKHNTDLDLDNLYHLV
jgi:hypothetical protein